MKLFFQKFGEGIPVVIVHGLYGSSDNWLGIAKELSFNFEVYIIDQRNHGKSPHNDIFNYEALADDLLEFIDEHNLKSAIFIGHSLGGKTIMQFAKKNSKRIINLIIIDIAPKSYLYSLSKQYEKLNHKQIIEAILSIKLDGIKKRKEINEELSFIIEEERLRLFLLKNLKRKKDNSFYWSLNFEAIHNNLELVLKDVGYEQFNKISIGIPTLFIRGANSNYVLDEDIEKIKNIFVKSKVITINNAGHWLHAEQPKELIKILIEFI